MYKSDLKHPSKTLQEKLESLFTLNRDKTVDLSFRPPFLNLLKAFGNPQDHLPPTIHVAGTNGKGSTIATLKSIYEAAGYSVHVYTSPHLIRFNERIVLSGKSIDNDALESLIDEALAYNDGASCTFFEITTAIAFAAFARNPADICLLEVGMGGRLDCTNIIKNPVLTIITTIGLDHTEYLGTTFEEVTAEKAGIMKHQLPCIIGAQNNENVLKTLEIKAKEHGSKLIHIGSDWSDKYTTPALIGSHQRSNAKAAILAVENLQNQFPVTKNQINQGLKNITWPARMQRLRSNIFDFNDTTSIWLDGGHNADAGHIIAAQLREFQKDGPVAVILCMMKHKDPKNFIKEFIPFCDALYFTQIPDEPLSMSANDLETAIGDIPHTKTSDYRDALKQIKQTQTKPAHILITGSLYLAGHVLQDIENQVHN